MRYIAALAHSNSATATPQAGLDAALVENALNNSSTLSTAQWQLLARKVGFFCGPKKPADTSVFKLLGILLSDAQNHALSYCIRVGKGLGKTTAATYFAHTRHNVHYIPCSTHTNRKELIYMVLQSAAPQLAATSKKLQQQLLEHIGSSNCPLFIFDDVHLLKKRVFHWLISLANTLYDTCGIVLLSSSGLQQTLAQSAVVGHAACTTYYNTVGKHQINITTPALADVEKICHTLGITATDVVHYIQQHYNNNFSNIEPLAAQHQKVLHAA